jgi:hypothetical protein
MFHYMKILMVLLIVCSNSAWGDVSAVTPNTVAGGLPSDEKPAEGGSAVTPNAVAGGLPSDEKPAVGGNAVTPNAVAGGLPSDEKPADGKIGGQIKP